MSVKDFNKNFGLGSSKQEEQRKFVNRIEQGVFRIVREEPRFNYENLFRYVCYEVGENFERFYFTGRLTVIPHLQNLTKNEFLATLKVLTAVRSYFVDSGFIVEYFDGAVQKALEQAGGDLGIRWKDGIFYPTGEALLDEELIDEALTVLLSYPTEQKDILSALANYRQEKNHGVVIHCYLAVEGLSRKLLSNGKTLLNNKNELLELLRFSRYWGNMLSAYIEYANEFSRHAGEKRHDLKPSEVEGFLYLTCLFIRVILRSHSERTGE